MKENWCRYNTLLDAITELAPYSERLTQYARAASLNENIALSAAEADLFEQLLPQWHRKFLQNKHYPAYAIKTSLARFARSDEDARDLWYDAAVYDTPAALPIVKISILVYPLIDLAIYRRQLCQSIISEIKRGNLKPYFYPESLEGRGLSDREKLQAFIALPLTEQVLAVIELNELGRGLTTTETFQRQAHTLWKRYHDRARGIGEPETPPTPTTSPTPPKPDTSAQIARWEREVERLWKTGKFRFHIDVCRRIEADEGAAWSAKHIAKRTAEFFRKLKAARKTK